VNESFSSVYSDSVFNVQWFNTLGNHDWKGNIPAQFNVTNIDSRWVMPTNYYKTEFEVDSDTTGSLFVLDTSPCGVYAENPEGEQMAINMKGVNFTAQLEWFTQQLINDNNDYCIVMGHHPVYAHLEAEGTTQLQTTIQPLLEKFGCIYLAGHIHKLQHVSVNGVDHYLSGAGALASTDDTGTAPATVTDDSVKFNSGLCGYMTLDLTAKDITASFYSYENNLLFQTVKTKPDRN